MKAARTRHESRRGPLIAFLTLTLTGLALGCTGTETGNPPLTDPPLVDPTEVRLEVSLATTDATRLRGNPGSIEPPRGRVIVFELESDAEPYQGLVQPDGSFEVEIFSPDGAELRLEVVDGRSRSAPLDVVASPDLPAVSHALGGCLTTSPATQLFVPEDGTPNAVHVHNGCADSVTLASPRLRRTVSTFRVEATSDVNLAPGEELRFDVQATDAVTEAEVLLLEVVAPSADRRAITLALAPL